MLDKQKLSKIVKNALAEDIVTGDITSNLTLPADAVTKMSFNAREKMIVCGIPVLLEVIEQINRSISVTILVKDGQSVDIGANLAYIEGNARSIMALERVALNFLQHMSGIATNAHHYAQEISGLNVTILDTRKTTPNLRILEKYAVEIGGCKNHRFCLDDGILIKDNHIHIAGGITTALQNAQKNNINNLKIEVECDTLEQVQEAITLGADVIMLDNMDCQAMSQAVAMVNDTSHDIKTRPLLEASGGVNLQNIKQIAQTGIDHISVGALTHGVKNIDIGLDMMD